MPDRVYIAIEGPIGVGKTTLARMLQVEFGAEALLEIFEENPFLSDFYADRERFAFQTQIVFLLSRYRQQHEAHRVAQRRSLISDYIFAKDRLFARLNLRGDELETYERLHNALAERVVVPDLVLYLRASPDVLMERIAMRDRPYERSMSRDYILALARAYEQFFAAYQGSRLLVVDTDGLNVVREPAHLQRVAAQIRAALHNGPPTMGDVPAAAASSAGEGALPAEAGNVVAAGDQVAQMHRECLALQQAVGELAGTLLGASTTGKPWQGVAGRLALHEALAACRAALQRLSAQVSPQ